MKLRLLFACLPVCLLTGCGPTGGKGIVELDSKPGGAEVFVDGKKKGTTPETEGQKLTMGVPEGDHQVEIRKTGFGTATKSVFTGAGTVQPLTVTMLPEGFTNSLGMKFVPVPGTQILMCIHETRNRDYAAYAAENSGVDMSWKGVVFDLGNNKRFTIKDDADHPVIMVSWEDATAFCGWLSRKDGRNYRLPTDHEWSCAVGIGDRENPRDTPEAKSGKIAGEYPWGTGYPPTRNNVGNYQDKPSWSNNGVDRSSDLGSYDDSELLTAPVMKYPANKLGIYDLGGNVWEWCQDAYSPSSASDRVLRGGSWIFFDDGTCLLSSYRLVGPRPDLRHNYYGLRCVVAAGSAAP